MGTIIACAQSSAISGKIDSSFAVRIVEWQIVLRCLSQPGLEVEVKLSCFLVANYTVAITVVSAMGVACSVACVLQLRSKYVYNFICR